MNKIVCEICGTSYPEANTQCPICGCVKPVDTGTAIHTDAGATGTYTYVKGGRFSKKNVKKRIGATELPTPTKGKKSANTTRTIAIIMVFLLLAVLAVGAYVAIDKYGDVLFPDLGATEDGTEQGGTDQGIVSIPCTSVSIDAQEVALEYAGEEMRILASVLPLNTTDIIAYTSESPEIVTVDSTGKLTAVSEGETVITVTCGSQKAQCRVVCTFPEETVELPVTEFKLNRSDFSLFYAGDSWRLYSGEIPVSEIVWSSDNEDVVIVELGRVVAVGEGQTTVRAVYDGKERTCIVRVKFTEAN